ANADDPPGELVHDDQDPVGPKRDRFGAVGRITRQVHAEVGLEAERRRAADDGFSKIDVAQTVSAGRWLAVLGRPLPAEVPLANAGGGIAVLAVEDRSVR